MSSNKTFSLLVLGGTSAIALAYVKKRIATLVDQGFQPKITLVGRDMQKMQAERADLQARGGEVECLALDLSLAQTKQVFTGHEAFDEVLLAYGVLTDQEKAQNDLDYLTSHLNTNFTSAAVWLEETADHFEKQGHGKALIIGSVAGDRGRQSNYAYGATKAGLATLVSGLQHRFGKSKHIHFLLVKPGFVDSPMTAHIGNKGALWASPERVAALMEKAAKSNRRVVYTPGFWRFIMIIIRNVPAFLFHRTSL